MVVENVEKEIIIEDVDECLSFAIVGVTKAACTHKCRMPSTRRERTLGVERAISYPDT